MERKVKNAMDAASRAGDRAAQNMRDRKAKKQAAYAKKMRKDAEEYGDGALVNLKLDESAEKNAPALNDYYFYYARAWKARVKT